ncbi:kinetochore protein [Carex littledalei]|uniref:Kinetochore protein n=1 Tax=Carex littledalei TaxID=544730 RepID=A0A833VUH6_9POAL|nr:kinetochore protein [Carex littledalei]
MSDSTTSKMIKLKSSGGKEFEVSDTVLVKQSQKICRLIETAFTENSIPLVNVNVTAPILEKVFEYCMKHVEAADASKTETTGKGCIKDDDFAAEKEECASIISGLKLSTEEKDSSASKTIKLKSNDGKEFEVSKTVAQQSQTICRLIEDVSTENSIPLVNVTAPILSKVIKYCTKHVDTTDASKTETTGEGCINSDEELKNWDKQFVDNIDKAAMLYDLIMAANYLNIEGLLDVTCRKMADMGKSTEEIRQAFNIKDDDQDECDSIISGLTVFDEKKKKKKEKKKKKIISGLKLSTEENC